MGNGKAWIKRGQKLQSVSIVSVVVGFDGVKGSDCREVCWFHLPVFPPPPTIRGWLYSELLRPFLHLLVLPADWKYKLDRHFLSLFFLWFPRFLGPLQWLKAECMQCRGSVQNSSLHPFLHSKNSSGQCKNFRNPTPSSGAVQQQQWEQTTDLPLNGRHVSRTGLLLNCWCSSIFPLGNTV